MQKKKKNNVEIVDEPCDIYDEEYVEELLEDDEITPEEEGFMVGYNGS